MIRGITRLDDYNPRIPVVLLLLLAAIASTPSPAHRRVFAPPARAADFEFAVTPRSIDEVTKHYRTVFPSPERGSWEIQRVNAVDLFDAAAMYDRPRLARLYGGRAARAARGPVTREGEVTAVVLLLSPYPEANLEKLNPGTLIMTVRVRMADRPQP